MNHFCAISYRLVYRSFHFNDDDEENLSEWVTSFIRDRYHLVCEERNAYQQMQSLMTGAIDNASSLHKMSEKEREQLEQQLTESSKAYLEARNVLQSTLVELGVSLPVAFNLTSTHRPVPSRSLTRRWHR
jgi:hypothetical protein